ncbi:hypothetical protein TIFTF001_020421 [Ficus carica]|uniref:Uncharacterized protein n=1 Tax=Ficus carica TaxID=3494 RepID=A0AA88DJL3_FICCA|nr:hypothetical protein TIFTF001_020421 [Ficus carica]
MPRIPLSSRALASLSQSRLATRPHGELQSGAEFTAARPRIFTLAHSFVQQKAEENIVDPFTKTLVARSYERHVETMGMQDMKHLLA